MNVCAAQRETHTVSLLSSLTTCELTPPSTGERGGGDGGEWIEGSRGSSPIC